MKAATLPCTRACESGPATRLSHSQQERRPPCAAWQRWTAVRAFQESDGAGARSSATRWNSLAAAPFFVVCLPAPRRHAGVWRAQVRWKPLREAKGAQYYESGYAVRIRDHLNEVEQQKSCTSARLTRDKTHRLASDTLHTPLFPFWRPRLRTAEVWCEKVCRLRAFELVSKSR